MGRYSKYKTEQEALAARDAFVKENQAAWEAASYAGDTAGMAQAHKNQEENMAEWDEYTGGKSTYDPGSGTWQISDGTRTDKNGVQGNSFLSPYYSKAGSAAAKRYDRVLKDYADRQFSYNPADDPLYSYYAKEYERKGRLAMDDTVAKIASRTGGIASSYAATAGANAYAGYMERLADKIPELRSLAYESYKNEEARYLKLMEEARRDMNEEKALYKENKSAYESKKKTEADLSASLIKAQTSGISSLSDDRLSRLYEAGYYYSPEDNLLYSADSAAYRLPDEIEAEVEPDKKVDAAAVALLKLRYKDSGFNALSDDDIAALYEAGYSFSGNNLISPSGEVFVIKSAEAPSNTSAVKKSASSSSSTTKKSTSSSSSTAKKSASSSPSTSKKSEKAEGASSSEKIKIGSTTFTKRRFNK